MLDYKHYLDMKVSYGKIISYHKEQIEQTCDQEEGTDSEVQMYLKKIKDSRKKIVEIKNRKFRYENKISKEVSLLEDTIAIILNNSYGNFSINEEEKENIVSQIEANKKSINSSLILMRTSRESKTKYYLEKEKVKKLLRKQRVLEASLQKYEYQKAISELLVKWGIIRPSEEAGKEGLMLWSVDELPSNKILRDVDKLLYKLILDLELVCEEKRKYSHHQKFINEKIEALEKIKLSYIHSARTINKGNEKLNIMIYNSCEDTEKMILKRKINFCDSLLHIKLFKNDKDLINRRRKLIAELELLEFGRLPIKKNKPSKSKVKVLPISERKTKLRKSAMQRNALHNNLFKAESKNEIIQLKEKNRAFLAKNKCVYFIKEHTTDKIKIGKTVNLKQRFYQIQNASPYNLEIVHIIKTNNIDNLERELHQLFSEKRVNREWFDLNETDIEQVKNLSFEYIA